jgi:glycosyltransferase involved in cell wall biosynthesis
MKILVHSHNYLREGAQIILFRLIRELVKRHEIHMVRLINRPGEPLIAEYEKLGARFVESVSMRDYDVLLCNTITASKVVTRAAGRCPVLWWIHEPKFGRIYMDMPTFRFDAYTKADRIVFPTQWQADTLYAKHLESDNWTVVPYGIGMDLSPQPAPFNREPGKFYLLHLGRVDRRKGQDLSALALKHLNHPDIRLVCVGNRPADDPYCAKVDAIGADIVYTGNVGEAEVAAYIQHCDAMVFPTRDDLITLAILEGLSFSKCVLASSFGPIPETIRHGETGLLSPVGDWQTLAGNIRMIYEDRNLMTRLGRRGRRILERKHGFQAHVDGMEAALTQIARR